MTALAPSTRHAVAYVHTVRNGADPEHRGHVYCSRIGETSPTSDCARCPRFVKTTAGTREWDEEVHCHSPESSLTGVVNGVAPLALPSIQVSALMTRDVVCVRPDLALSQLVRLFSESGLEALPVVGSDGRLLGFVSEAVVMRALYGTAAKSDAGSGGTVGDVMQPFAVALPETASVSRAASVMAYEGQARVAIVSATGTVVGILSAGDIMYWLGRSDGHVLPRGR